MSTNYSSDEVVDTPRVTTTFTPMSNRGSLFPDATLPKLPKSPTMGGLHESTNGNWIPWTGGKPLADWSGLDLSEASDTMSNPTQFRPQDSTDIKPYSFRVQALKKLFDKTQPVELFIEDVDNHLTSTGMDSIAYLPDPADKSKMTSVVTHHGRFNLQYSTKQSNAIKTKWDSYDIANDKSAKKFLLSSLKPQFKTRMNKIIKPSDTFTIVWIKIMRKIHINSKEYFDSKEDSIKARDPRTYPAQKIDDWVADMRIDVQLLTNSGQYKHDLSQDIIDLALLAGGDGNEDWRSVIRPMRNKLNELLCEVGLFSTKDEVNQRMLDEELDPEDILDKIEHEYLTLLNRKDWPPANNPIDNSAPPARKFQEQSGLNAEITSNISKNKSNSTSPYSKKSSFNKKGKYNINNKSWKFTAPKSNESQTIQKNGKTWYWCQKCNAGEGRWSTTHGTSSHTGKPNNNNNNNNNNTHQVNVTFTEDDINDVGVWCTADLVDEDYTSTNLSFIIHLLGIMFVMYTMFCGIGRIQSAFVGSSFMSSLSSLSPLSPFQWFSLPSSLTMLSILQYSIIGWVMFFIFTGTIETDMWIENILTGGHVLFISGGQVIHNEYSNMMTFIVGSFQVFLSVFITYFDQLQGFITRDLFVNDNLWFLAPLSWLIVAYVSIYLARRDPKIVYKYIKYSRKQKKITNYFKPRSKQTYVDDYLSLFPDRNKAVSTANKATIFNASRHYSKVRRSRAGPSRRFNHSRSKSNLHSDSPYDHNNVNHIWRKLYQRELPRHHHLRNRRSHQSRSHQSRSHQSRSHPSRSHQSPYFQRSYVNHGSNHRSFNPLPINNRASKLYPNNAKPGYKPCRSFKCRPVADYKRQSDTRCGHTNHSNMADLSLNVFKYHKANQIVHQLQFGFTSFHYDNPSCTHHEELHSDDHHYALATLPEDPPSVFHSYILDPIVHTIKAGGNLLHRVLLTAPQRTLNSMERHKFNIIWDTGASISISPCKDDFIELHKPKSSTTLTGISKGLKVEGEGVVKWCIMDDNGGIRSFELSALYVPKCKVRLLRPHAITELFRDESITFNDNGLQLSGSPDDDSRPSLTVYISPSNNLPTCSGFTDDGISKAHTALTSSISVVHESNLNLSNAQKHFLQWHLRLGHPGYNRLMYIFRTGALSTSESERRMIKSVLLNVTHVPKCAACLFGKQTRRPIPGKITKVIQERRGVLKKEHVNPGDEISIDHFVCSVRGRLFNSRGKTKEDDMYEGGLIAVDQASNYVYVGFQQDLNSHQTLLCKEAFERECRDHGVIVQKYLSDRGTAFTSKQFSDHLANLEQVIRFAGVGTHHHNGQAERAIRTIMAMSRTMMLHSAIHWPDVADPALWPMAVNHAVFLYNRIPDPSTGFSPLDIFSRTRWPLKNLTNMHVWGCPVYVLDKRMIDGKKIPRWKPRSERCMYMGVCPNHSHHVPTVLNIRTGAITSQYHVVFDDWFSTVPSSPSEIPNFNSDDWKKLFGDSKYQYHEDNDDSDELSTVYETLPNHQSRIEASNRKYKMVPHNDPTPIQSFSRSNVFGTSPMSSTRETQGISTSLDPVPSSTHNTSVTSSSSSTPTSSEPIQQPYTSDNNSSVHATDPTPSSATKSNVCYDIVTNPDINPSNTTTKSTSASSPVIIDLSDESSSDDDSVSSSHHPAFKPSRQNKTNIQVSKPNLRSRRARKRPEYMIEESHQALVAKKKEDPDILTWDEAMASPERNEWIKAAQTEMDQLLSHETWKEVPISDAGDAKVLPTTWIFKIKRHPDGSLLKMKGRLAVRGDLEECSNDTYAPVCEFSSVRLFLAICLMRKWYTCAIDFNNAFVQAYLPEPVWIYPPRGFYKNKRGTILLRLLKSLYGLKEAPKLWFNELFKWLLDPELGLTQSTTDKCFLYRKDMIVIIYVDDMGVAASTEEAIDELFKFLESKGLSLTKEGTFNEYLGIKFNSLPNGSVHMSQSGLIKKIIAATGMDACNPNKTPALKACLAKDPEGEPMSEKWNYRSIVGMLLYLSSNTRPDICFAVSQVARFCHDPKKSHATAVKMIVRYLASSIEEGIIVPPVDSIQLRCYVDADFSGLYKHDPDNDSTSAKSRSGFILFLGSCPLIWKSYLQSEVALSTLEAEYAALSGALRVVLPITNIINQLTTVIETPEGFETVFHSGCIVFEDNAGALSLATNQRVTSRTKYFNVKWHHFWQFVNDGTIVIEKIPTTDQLADYLTKGLTREVFVRLRKIVQGW